jgi:hypothetical protein
MKLTEFQKKFKALRKKGWVKTHRKGPTGVGHTLEQELGMTENNIAGSDFKFAELKAHRLNSSSLITLFTFNRKVWKIKPIDAVKKYGTPDENGRLGIYFTMGQTPNSAGLFLDFKDEEIELRHKDGTLVAVWPVEELVKRFKKKYPALVLVSAESEERNGVEFFWYNRAQLLRETSPATLVQQFRAGTILLDLRLHDKGTSARNHGTGFRAYERSLTQIFSKSEDI